MISKAVEEILSEAGLHSVFDVHAEYARHMLERVPDLVRRWDDDILRSLGLAT